MALRALLPTGTRRSFGAFSQDADHAHLHVYIADFHVAQFAGAKTAGVEQFQDRHVAGVQLGLGIGGGDQLIDLGAAEDLGQRALGLGPLKLLENFGGRVAGGGQVAQQRADGGQPSRDGAGGLAAAALVLEIFAEVQSGGAEDGLAALGEEVVQVFQVAAVGVQGVFRQAALSRQMKKEIADLSLGDSGIDQRR